MSTKALVYQINSTNKNGNRCYFHQYDGHPEYMIPDIEKIIEENNIGIDFNKINKQYKKYNKRDFTWAVIDCVYYVYKDKVIHHHDNNKNSKYILYTTTYEKRGYSFSNDILSSFVL